MKQIILSIAILTLSLNIFAQQLENKNLNTGQLYFSAPSNFERTSEPNVSEAARNFNNKGVEVALKENNFEAAAELFRKAVASDEYCLGCKYNLGMALINTKNLDESIKVFTDLSLINPQYANAYIGLGESYGKKGLFKESVSVYQKAVELDPNNVIVLCNLGNALHQIKEYKKALTYFDRAIEINPGFVVAHSNRGTTLYGMGRNKEAIKSFQKALALQPDLPEAQNNLGVVLSDLGKEKEANQHFSEAVRLSPKWNYALYNLAMSNIELGRRNAVNEQISRLEQIDEKLAKNLKKAFWGKFLLDVSDVK
jgi:superkiller protein 3